MAMADGPLQVAVAGGSIGTNQLCCDNALLNLRMVSANSSAAFSLLPLLSKSFFDT
jgi:hypothetical protein